MQHFLFCLTCQSDFTDLTPISFFSCLFKNLPDLQPSSLCIVFNYIQQISEEWYVAEVFQNPVKHLRWSILQI